MEHHADKGVYPPIQVHITLGNEDLTVKVMLLFFNWCTGIHITCRRHNLFLEILPLIAGKHIADMLIWQMMELSLESVSIPVPNDWM